MEFTQSALLLLVIFWLLQVAGSWIQIRHYRQALSTAGGRWSDGYLGMGQSRSRFGRGAIVLLEVSPDLRVRQLQTLSGLTVFARFKPEVLVKGWTLAQLGNYHAPGVRETPVDKAIRQALIQVEEVRSRHP